MKTLLRSFLMLVAMFALVALVVACAQYSPPSTPPGPTPTGGTPSKTDVAIKGFAFDPGTVTINARTTVVWTNQDSAPHQIAPDGSGEDFSSGVLQQGDSFAYTFTTPGTYTYHCSIHPMMKGTIIVK